MLPSTKVKILRVFSPIRIIEIIIILSLIPYLKIHWESAAIIFYAFFPIIVGSVIFEGILSGEGFRKGFTNAGFKYIMGISIQFLGFAVFALSSFNQDPKKEPIIIMYSLLVMGIGGLLEAFHIFITKKLKDVKLSPLQSVLGVIAMTVMIFFAGWQVVFMSSVFR